MPALPPVVAWTLGAIGAVVLVKLFNREWQRVNAELDQAQSGAGDRSRARRRCRRCGAIPRPASTGRIAESLTRPQCSASLSRLLDALLAHQLAPARELVLEELAELLRRVGDRHRAGLDQLLLHHRIVDRGDEGGVELGDHRRRRLGRREQPVPVVRRRVRIAQLGQRRHVRQHRIALAGGGAERLDLAGR